MVTEDGPVLQLDIDHLKQAVYLNPVNLSVLVSMLTEAGRTTRADRTRSGRRQTTIGGAG
jgi:hypothetical protein